MIQQTLHLKDRRRLRSLRSARCARCGAGDDLVLKEECCRGDIDSSRFLGIVFIFVLFFSAMVSHTQSVEKSQIFPGFAGVTTCHKHAIIALNSGHENAMCRVMFRKYARIKLVSHHVPEYFTPTVIETLQPVVGVWNQKSLFAAEMMDLWSNSVTGL